MKGRKTYVETLYSLAAAVDRAVHVRADAGIRTYYLQPRRITAASRTNQCASYPGTSYACA
ncbi:MAG TPA: hypothetical protein VNE38_12055 [Ktedonobacteraceae bacterium]|nr:hypothetical protein [Ktedonobacteraceae bacterium]